MVPAQKDGGASAPVVTPPKLVRAVAGMQVQTPEVVAPATSKRYTLAA
jgi:hypothetical protein